MYEGFNLKYGRSGMVPINPSSQLCNPYDTK
jgi:hypothetical protein